jgi:hypothetical protein
MKIVTIVSMLILGGFVTSAVAQNFEITPQVGGQINGGYDLSTSLFNRLEVANGVNYGITAGYLIGEHYGIEFQWNRNSADTVAKLQASERQLFLNQTTWAISFHFTSRSEGATFLLFRSRCNSLDPNEVGSVDQHGLPRWAEGEIQRQ